MPAVLQPTKAGDDELYGEKDDDPSKALRTDKFRPDKASDGRTALFERASGPDPAQSSASLRELKNFAVNCAVRRGFRGRRGAQGAAGAQRAPCSSRRMRQRQTSSVRLRRCPADRCHLHTRRTAPSWCDSAQPAGFSFSLLAGFDKYTTTHGKQRGDSSRGQGSMAASAGGGGGDGGGSGRTRVDFDRSSR